MWLFSRFIWNHVIEYPKKTSLYVHLQRSSELPSCVITLPYISFREKFQNGRATVFVHLTLVRLSTFPLPSSPPQCPESGWTLDGVVKLYWKAIIVAQLGVRCAFSAQSVPREVTSSFRSPLNPQTARVDWLHQPMEHLAVFWQTHMYSTDIDRSKSPRGPIQRNYITKHRRG